jgi:basic membrane protein A
MTSASTHRGGGGRQVEASGRDADYLLIGSRLAGYEAWSRNTVLRLTTPERRFLDAGIARREADLAEEADRRRRQVTLERRARSRLWVALGAIAVLAAAASFALLSWLGSGPPDVALVFEGSGDPAFGNMALDGFDRAIAEFGLDGETRIANTGTPELESAFRGLAEDGVPLVLDGLGASSGREVETVASEYPETRFVTWEQEGSLPNVTYLAFRSEEAAYLAGAAAALTSETRVIGFIGGCQAPIIDAYLAGFTAGAHHVDPGVEVRRRYLTACADISGFNSPTLGELRAGELYADGADVILAAGSSLGVFQAAHVGSEALGRQLWAIGVDTDEYVTVLDTLVPEGQDPAAWQPHILTSVLKRLDEAFYRVLEDYAAGDLASGPRSVGLADETVGISWSGGFLDELRPQLASIERQIVLGEILVQTVPDAVASPAP